MAVVVDASVLLVLVSGDPRRHAAERAVRDWLAQGEDMHAPSLLPYEVASGLTRMVARGALPADHPAELWSHIRALPIVYHPLLDVGKVTKLALRLRRSSAYDAAYLALADELRAQLWAFDGPLAANAATLGYQVCVPS